MGQVHSASWCRVLHSRLPPSDLDMMSGWDVSSLVMCEMPLSFGHFSDTGVGYFHLCDLGWMVGGSRQRTSPVWLCRLLEKAEQGTPSVSWYLRAAVESRCWEDQIGGTVAFFCLLLILFIVGRTLSTNCALPIEGQVSKILVFSERGSTV